MLDSHEKLHSRDSLRQILIVDDELTNRAILGNLLQEEYEILYACDGAQALETIRSNRDTLSLVILDVMMPGMSGLDVLRALGQDRILSSIPVIVWTSEPQYEEESLNLGAQDFIPKDFFPPVVRARVRRTIELSERRTIISYTEQDDLTGLYTREYFYGYARQMDLFHRDRPMDAVIMDITHFHMINERFGKDYGDRVLKRLGAKIQEHVQRIGGIACRREADTFMIYCPHQEDHSTFMEEVSASLAEEDPDQYRVRVRMGVYPDVEKSIDMELRFDRAKMAADSVRETLAKNIGYYDQELHEKQLYAEQLIEDFPAALKEDQFQVYYQPKFDIRPDTPVLVSAEALVRWEHPRRGMISPGDFIPLFEKNGLIGRLDDYVWRQTARQIRDWKDRLDHSVPVSVNVSRIDMFDEALPRKLQGILREHSLKEQDMLLEVTESAYTRDAEKIIRMVEDLRSLGFRVEMDDFGTGYSSLHMISELPIDALKLDRRFISSAFERAGNDQMLRVIISLAKHLDVPVIAEGVETETQMHALRHLGCDIVQGYFFSRPVPASEFEAFILQKKEADLRDAEKEAARAVRDESGGQDPARQAKLEALRRGAGEASEEEDAWEDAMLEDTGEHTGIQLKTATVFFAVLAVIAALALLITDVSVTQGHQRMKEASDRYIQAQMAASDMESGSDYLTDRVRCFVVTGEVQYLKDFVEEVEVTKRRDEAVRDLEILLGGSDSTALDSLNTALMLSNELIGVENHAMRLMTEIGQYAPEDIPENVAQLQLSEEDMALSVQEKKAKAQALVFDNNYMHYKDRIRENVRLCTEALIHSSSQELEKASAQLSLLVRIQTGMSLLFLLIVVCFVVMVTRMIRRPLTNMVLRMQEKKPVRPTGVEELRFVTRTYNRILKENREAEERLSHEASHDPLTGLFNRGAYNLWMETADTGHIALLIIDVDHFKAVNDTYGHVVGDRVLKRVADVMRKIFRSADVLCRLGGDEFVVIMTRMDSSMEHIVRRKAREANDLLQHPKDDLPPVSLSIGAAFSDREAPEGDIYADADRALYRIKESGRAGCEIF